MYRKRQPKNGIFSGSFPEENIGEIYWLTHWPNSLYLGSHQKYSPEECGTNFGIILNS